MEPTSETVGSPENAKALPVDRPMSLILETQFVRESEGIVVGAVTGRSLSRWFASKLRVGLLIAGAVATCAPLNAVEDAYTAESEAAPKVDFYRQEKIREAASERQEQFRMRVSIQHAVGENVSRMSSRGIAPEEKQKLLQTKDESAEIFRQGILLVVAAILTFLLAVSILAPAFIKRVINKLKPWNSRTGNPTGVADKVRAEDEYFAEFLTAFQTVVSSGNDSVTSGSNSLADAERQQFFSNAARLVSAQRLLLQSIVSATSDTVRIRFLGDLRRELNAFKSAADSPEFLPAWQTASSLEGLLKQLTDKVGNATRSTLRTVGCGIDLLAELSKPGVRRDILTQPPLKFLAVDDDVISRTAVTNALKKVFNQPDIADSGNSALAMAAKTEYDAIFLDVQMPGMDGYEVCSRIHDTPANKQTPVVFVTCMSDFDARAQSILNGGSDLIGKPFLTFEITVKALTLALSRRLRSVGIVAGALDVAPCAVGVLTEVSSAHDCEVATSTEQCASVHGVADTTAALSAGIDCSGLVMHNLLPQAADLVSESCDNLEVAFVTHAATQFAALKDLIRSTSETTDEITRQEMLSEFYLGLHALSPEMDADEGHPTMRVSSALEGLIRKLLESPVNWTSSMLLTITNAVDLMDDLCARNVATNLMANAPIRILAVDDDPIARRAIVGALQVAFMKPETAENGEAALARAMERPFDLIFMDVQMPGMDGFEACSKIRQTKANGETPIVFMTSNADANARGQVATSGGNGIIAKPFLTAEVTIKALTFALRGQIEKCDLSYISQGPLQKNSLGTKAEPRRERQRRRNLQKRESINR